MFFGQNLSNKAIIKTKQVQPLPFFLPLLPSSPLFLFLFLSSVFELFGRKTLANSNDGKFDRFVLKQSARCSSLKVYVENRAENMFCWIFENVSPEKNSSMKSISKVTNLRTKSKLFVVVVVVVVFN